jgi:hypothetical protein
VRSMWKCPGCGEAVDDHFDTCWNCEESKPESPTQVFHAPDPSARQESVQNVSFWQSRSLRIKVPLLLLLLFVASAAAYDIYKFIFRRALFPR